MATAEMVREDELRRRGQRQGRDLVFALHAAAGAIRLYPLENRAVQMALEELARLGAALQSQEGEARLRLVGNHCFLNDLRLRLDVGSQATLEAVSRLLERHGVGQVEIGEDAGAAEWSRALQALLAEGQGEGEEAYAGLQARLQASGVRAIQFLPPPEWGGKQEGAQGAGEGAGDGGRLVARETYAHSVAVARDAMFGARMGKGVSMRKVKRAVQRIVDQVLDNETSMMGMTVLRDYDQYTFTHSVNVCIFSVALGKKLGLGKKHLYELGLGALMHDLGKANIPIEVTTKAGALDPEEWALVREHPTEGMLGLLELPGLDELPLRPMLMAYEHHMKTDLSGYPSSRRPRKQMLFSRIVAIADGFDAATTQRSYQKKPWLPDAVLKGMRENPERGFDPLLVKAFISLTGFYPVGSVVILDTYELALVVGASTRPECPHQPQVRILFDDMGMPIMEEVVVDLAETNPETGEPKRTIIKTTDAERYGINVQEYFL